MRVRLCVYVCVFVRNKNQNKVIGWIPTWGIDIEGLHINQINS